MSQEHNSDFELEAVVARIQELDPHGERIARTLRQTLDQLYDGQNTGRYRWDQLHKTEKTHCGTLVEINLCREFQFADGEKMDYRIADTDVDCKYSQSKWGWMIPLEAMGHLCIVVCADDPSSRWSMGVVRIREEILSSGGGNRDSKKTIIAAGRSYIRWLFEDAILPPNLLLHLSRTTVDAIMAMNGGQKKVNEIFRVAQGVIISRVIIATLAQQDDFMKRVRGNGGARSILKSEGIMILGHFDEHRRIAQGLGLPIPEIGELVSVRVVRAKTSGAGMVKITGQYWRVANESDPPTAAPNYTHH